MVTVNQIVCRVSNGGFSAMAALQLNSQGQQYGGFTPGHRVFGRTQKLPIGTAGNPNFTDFVNPTAAPAAKSLSLINTISKYEKHLRNRILTENAVVSRKADGKY